MGILITSTIGGTMPELELRNSLHQGTKIIVLGKDPKKLDEFEAQTEADGDFVRIDVFTTGSVSEACNLVKQHQINLAIFEDGVEDLDFVYLQMELLKFNPKIELVPIVLTPSITQLRESKKGGSVFDFGPDNLLSSYDHFKSYIQTYLREKESSQESPQELLDYVNSIQSALLIEHEELRDHKEHSHEVLKEVLKHYDFSMTDNLSIIAAERLYMPNLKSEKYSELLGKDAHNLLPYLEETSSWHTPEDKPTGAFGFVITLSNYITHLHFESSSPSTIVEKILDRPLP